MVQERFKLSEAQLAAIEVLADGGSAGEAAKAAGVTRQTVSGWRNHNPAFIAALNGHARMEVRQAHAGLLKLAPRAVAVLADDLERENDRVARSKAALDVLKLIDRIGSHVVGSADPVVIESEIAAAADDAMLSSLSKMIQAEDDPLNI